MKQALNLNNGITVSVIDDGYGKNIGLFEVSAWVTTNPYINVTKKVWKEKASGDNVIGWLTDKDVKEFIRRASRIKTYDGIDTRKKYRISEKTGGVYSPGFRFGDNYVEGHYGDPAQRSYRDFGTHKDRALKEMSLETYQKWMEGSGLNPKQIAQRHNERDQQLEVFYRKKKVATKSKSKRKPVKRCKCK